MPPPKKKKKKIMFPVRRVACATAAALAAVRVPARCQSAVVKARRAPLRPLSLVSWSVDGAGHTHHRCRRRLPLAERIPGIVATIRAAGPDVVALQDSTPEVAAALTGSNTAKDTTNHNSNIDGVTGASHVHGPAATSSSSSSPLVMDVLESLAPQVALLIRWQQRLTGPAAAAVAGDDGDGGNNGCCCLPLSPLSTAPPTDKEEGKATAAAVDAAPLPLPLPSYTLVATARNGRCGEVQVFSRVGSAWQVRPLPDSPGATVELVCSDPSLSSSSSTSQGDREKDASAVPSSSSAPPQQQQQQRLIRFTLSNVDLSYRGKSLAVGGRLLAGADVSRDGSPFSLVKGKAGTHNTNTIDNNHHPTAAASGSQQRRAKGELDAHRGVALDFLARVTRPSLLVGNLFMGKAEAMPSAGKHAYGDAWAMAGGLGHQEHTINTFAAYGRAKFTNYFYFCPTAGVARSNSSSNRSARSDTDNTVGAGEEQGEATTTAEARIERVSPAQIGASLPLSSTLSPSGREWEVPADSGDADDAHIDATAVATDLGVPEVAGRSQRCFIRHYSGGEDTTAAATATTATGPLDLPVSQVFRRCRVLALQPAVVAALSPAEAAWHRQRGKVAPWVRAWDRRHHREATVEEDGMKNDNDDDDDNVSASTDSTGKDGGANASQPLPGRVPCSLSDQYPLYVLLS